MNGFWDYAHALRSRFYVVLPAALAGAVLAVVIAQLQHKQYRATTRLLVESKRPRLVSADAEGGMRTSDHAEMQTQALLVQSQAVARRTVLKLNLEKEGPFTESEDVNSALLDSLRVKPVRDTRFLEVSCETTDAEWAASIANAVATSYIEENLERRRKRLTEVTGVYSLQYPELDKQLQEADARLVKFQEDYLVVSSENPEATLRQRELKLIEQLSMAQRERIAAQSKLMQLENDDDRATTDTSLARAISAEDAWVRQLLQERLNQAARIVEMRQTYSDGHRELETAKKRMVEIEKELREAIQGYTSHARRTYEAAKWKEEEVQRILTDHRKQLASLRQVLARYEALRQRRDSLHRLLDPLAKSRAELELAKGLDVASAIIVDRAQKPKFPSRPIHSNYIIIGSVLGLLLGVRLAFALETANATVRTREDVRQMVGLETVGTVARIDRHIAPNDRTRANTLFSLPSSRTAEQFRSLRTGVLATGAWRDKGRGGVALVTSSNLGEGKSVVAVNIAQAFAQLGAPVLLVDADLRRSTVHDNLGLSAKPGLTDVLRGGASLDDVIRETSVPNLSVITAGTTTDTPAELLAGTGMRDVIEKATARFDSIWIDSPPVIPVADARDIIPLTDLVLLVVRSGLTRQHSLMQACELLHVTEGQEIRTVINDMSNTVARQYGYDREGYYSRSPSKTPPPSGDNGRPAR